MHLDFKDEHLRTVETILNYPFQDRSLLALALTSRMSGTSKSEGNRRLAQLGQYETQAIYVWCGYGSEVPRSHIDDSRSLLSTVRSRANVARLAGLDRYLMYDHDAKTLPRTVLADGVSAIIGAVSLDSWPSRDVVVGVMLQLCMFRRDSNTINPALLSAAFGSAGHTRAKMELFGSDFSLATPLPLVQAHQGRLLSEDTVRQAGQITTRRPFAKRLVGATNQPGINSAALETVTGTIGSCGLVQKASPRTSDSSSIAKRFEAFMTSSSTIDIFREALRSWRTSTHGSFDLAKCNSMLDHLQLIQDCSERAAYCHFLRRIAILKVFRASGGSDTPSCKGWVNVGTPTTFKGRPGNPISRAEHDISKQLLARFCNQVEPGSDEYKDKLKLMTNVRKLGCKLHLFAQTFHDGVLGLMPPPGGKGAAALGLSDSALIKMDMVTFRSLVNVLNNSQGDMIRRLSKLVEPVVVAMSQGGEPRSQPFDLEIR